jgi:transposase, IS5 family
MARKRAIARRTLFARNSTVDQEQAQKRDPEMSSSKKGNQWCFGMKAHVGGDAESGLVHTAGVTTGKVHD